MKLKRWTQFLIGFALAFSLTTPTHATNTLTLGILSVQPKDIEQKKWDPIIQLVNHKLKLQNKDVRLQAQLYYYGELEQAVSHHDLDLIFTNPAHYVELAQSQGLSSPLVSQIQYFNDEPTRGFGGVIITHASRKDINSLEDIAGSKVAIPKFSSFGGYMMQSSEVKKHGINLKSLEFVELEMPHAKSVTAVVNQQADLAFIRTGVIESMVQNGLLNRQDIKILNQQNLPYFPLEISTQVYPEWPLAALSHIDSEIAAQITSVFLSIPYGDPILKAANTYAFSIPADYSPVRNIMRELKVKPFNLEIKISWQEKLQIHYKEIIVIIITMLIILLLALMLYLYNRKLQKALDNVEEKQEELKLSAVAFDTQEAILITDADEKIVRVNKAFTKITGYKPEEVLGKTPRVLSSGMQNKEFYKDLWQDILNFGGWQGEILNRRKSGEVYPELMNITAIKNPDGEITHYLSNFTDISHKKMTEDKIHKLSFYDSLTGLANKTLLENSLAQALVNSQRNMSHGALIFLDLDHFKNINDTLGHKLGDEVLKLVANKIQATLRDRDLLVRPGGDEFIILIENLGNNRNEAANQMQFFAQKLLDSFKEPIYINKSSYVLTASIGVNLFLGKEVSTDELMQRADLAMFQAKAEGRNQFKFFDPEMHDLALKRSLIEANLRQAIMHNQFSLFYQPKVDSTIKTHGYEALIRWNEPQKGIVAPGYFIPIAEETDLIISIGNWVIAEACRTLQYWQNNNKTAHLSLSINISAVQFRQSNFVNFITDQVKLYGISPEKLELEITESILMENTEIVISKMHQLSALGLSFSLDDFGTGYSSLSYLKNLPFSCLKIDKSFVDDMLTDPNDAVIVSTIITLAKSLNLEVVAEGVETSAQADELIKLGCDLLQGYFYGKPQPLTLGNKLSSNINNKDQPNA